MYFTAYKANVIARCKKAGIVIRHMDNSDIEKIDDVIEQYYKQKDSVKEAATIIIDEYERCFN